MVDYNHYFQLKPNNRENLQLPANSPEKFKHRDDHAKPVIFRLYLENWKYDEL